MSNSKKLFRVLSAGGNVEGEFASKMAAKKFRDQYNSRLSKGDRVSWVSVGPDHWRWNTNRNLTQRTELDDIRMMEALTKRMVAEQAEPARSAVEYAEAA